MVEDTIQAMETKLKERMEKMEQMTDEQRKQVFERPSQLVDMNAPLEMILESKVQDEIRKIQCTLEEAAKRQKMPHTGNSFQAHFFSTEIFPFQRRCL